MSLFKSVFDKIVFGKSIFDKSAVALTKVPLPFEKELFL